MHNWGFNFATQIGGPGVYLNRPNTHTLLKEICDGNCLFRCFTHIITASPDHHYEVRMFIIRYMRQISHLQVGSMLTEVGEDIEAFISDTKLDVLGSYGTRNEMVTLSHLLLCNIYSFGADFAFSWSICTLITNIDGHNAQIKTLMSFVDICLSRLVNLHPADQGC